MTAPALLLGAIAATGVVLLYLCGPLDLPPRPGACQRLRARVRSRPKRGGRHRADPRPRRTERTHTSATTGRSPS